MGLYEAAKDALKVAQSADNVELVQKLLDVQKMALDMQEKQQELQSKAASLEAENNALKESKKYSFEPGRSWLIDPDEPRRKLCPVCTAKLKSPVPVFSSSGYCGQCKGYFK